MLKMYVWVITMWLLIKAPRESAGSVMTQIIFCYKVPRSPGLNHTR